LSEETHNIEGDERRVTLLSSHPPHVITIQKGSEELSYEGSNV